MPRQKKTPTKVAPKRGRRGFMVKKKKNPEFVLMTLNIKHTRRGNVFGPGTKIQVPFDFVREFQYEEQCDRQVEERLHSDRAMLVLRGNRVKQIPVEAFDSGLVDEYHNPSHRT